MATVRVSLPLPVLPQGWSGEKDFKSIGELSSAIQRNIEPVGPHFLAHARRVSHSSLQIIKLRPYMLMNVQKRHQRTFSEDDRIQAQENVKKVEDDDGGDISEPEDPLMLQRDAKDWKVIFALISSPPLPRPSLTFFSGTRPLRCSRPFQISLQSNRIPNQTRPPQEGSPSSSRQEGRCWIIGRRLILQMHPKSDRSST